MKLVVSGGSRGIGRAIVLAAVDAGDDVAFTYRDNEAAAETTLTLARSRAGAAHCSASRVDQRDPDACEDFAESVRADLGSVDAVVCNAGIARDGLAFSMKDAAWREVIDTNLSGSFFFARAFLGDLLASRNGRLVFVSSIAAAGAAGQCNYAATKAGLIGLAKSLAKEYGPKGLTSNVVSPGIVETEFIRDKLSADRGEFWKRFCPARRMGQAAEVAAATLFLCRPDSGFINGAVLPVTGGLGWSP